MEQEDSEERRRYIPRVILLQMQEQQLPKPYPLNCSHKPAGQLRPLPSINRRILPQQVVHLMRPDALERRVKFGGKWVPRRKQKTSQDTQHQPRRFVQAQALERIVGPVSEPFILRYIGIHVVKPLPNCPDLASSVN